MISLSRYKLRLRLLGTTLASTEHTLLFPSHPIGPLQGIYNLQKVLQWTQLVFSMRRSSTGGYLEWVAIVEQTDIVVFSIAAGASQGGQ